MINSDQLSFSGAGKTNRSIGRQSVGDAILGNVWKRAMFTLFTVCWTILEPDGTGIQIIQLNRASL